MDMSKHVGNKFLSAADYPRPAVLTIMQVSEEPIGQHQEIKVIIWFEAQDKGMVQNRTNLTTLIDLFGTESDNWLGQKIEVYTDNNVQFAGKRTPALRLRAPQARPVPPTRPGPSQPPPAQRSNPRIANEGLVYDDSIPDPA